jgi:hypothetical protein
MSVQTVGFRRFTGMISSFLFRLSELESGPESACTICVPTQSKTCSLRHVGTKCKLLILVTIVGFLTNNANNDKSTVIDGITNLSELFSPKPLRLMFMKSDNRKANLNFSCALETHGGMPVKREVQISSCASPLRYEGVWRCGFA